MNEPLYSLTISFYDLSSARATLLAAWLVAAAKTEHESYSITKTQQKPDIQEEDENER